MVRLSKKDVPVPFAKSKLAVAPDDDLGAGAKAPRLKSAPGVELPDDVPKRE
jgi:hypothetical protein